MAVLKWEGGRKMRTYFLSGLELGGFCRGNLSGNSNICFPMEGYLYSVNRLLLIARTDHPTGVAAAAAVFVSFVIYSERLPVCYGARTIAWLV